MEIERLIEQCRQGNREALGNLYKAYAQRMRGICRRYVSDPEAVDDVLHDAFIVIFTSFDRLRDEEKAEAWMTGIVRNVALKYRKRIMAVKTVSEDEVNEEALSTAAESETTELKATFEEIMQMVNKLPEGYGKVFRLSVFEGLSHKEIAEALGIEPHSSSSQLARAKKMMRKMIKQYWVWLLIPLLIPVSVIILYYKQSARDKKTSDLPKTTGVKMYKSNTSIAHLPINSKQSSSYETYLSSGVKITEVLTPDSVSGIMEQHEACPPIIYGKEQPDTVSAILLDTVSTVYRIEPPKYNPVALRHKETKDHRGWNMYVAYSGSVQGDRSRTNDYMSMPSLSKGITRSTRIYNWGEYIEYVMENSENMDSLSALNMRRIALINSNTPQEPLTEKSNHERPLTIQLLLNRQFNRHWSFTAGLSFNRLKSTFESGNEKTLIYRTQRIHYLGVPLKVNFHIMDDYRLTLYTSGGIQLDFPVNARLTTNYRYSNAYGHIDDSQDINAKIHAPCQLSFGVGVGLQYEILPHVNVFLEPSLNYYIPNGQGIETYRTVHPLDVSIPIGIKLCW